MLDSLVHAAVLVNTQATHCNKDATTYTLARQAQSFHAGSYLYNAQSKKDELVRNHRRYQEEKNDGRDDAFSK